MGAGVAACWLLSAETWQGVQEAARDVSYLDNPKGRIDMKMEYKCTCSHLIGRSFEGK